MPNSRFSMAVHIIAYLASEGEGLVPSSQIATSVNTNPVVIRRLLSELTKAGIVRCSEGKLGGYQLVKCPEDINLWEIYKALGEEHLFAIHANPPKKGCKISCDMKDVLSDVFGKAEFAAQRELKGTSVKQLVKKLIRS